MEIDELTVRQEEIKAAIRNMTAQLSILHGHEAEIQHWLKKLKEKQPVEDKEEVVVE